VASAVARLDESIVTTSAASNEMLEGAGIAPVSHPTSLAELLRRPESDLAAIERMVDAGFGRWIAPLPDRLKVLLEEEVKYGAFVERERREVQRRAALEDRAIPSTIDFSAVGGLRTEANLKLTAHRPRTIGEASRLSGVTPADVAALLIHAAKAEAAAT
jgi:tRNA uridine 5-carboxymethylaminomethyl modification enzyme